MSRSAGLMLLWLLIITFGAPALAAPELSGRTRFQFGPNNATVEFGADAIVNNADNTSGTIKVQLWALNYPYEGDGLDGHLVAEFKLDALYAGNEYRPAWRNLAARLPPRRGNYVMALVVSEFQHAGNYQITDWRNFDNRVSLAPATLFKLRGPWRWQSDVDRGTLSLWLNQISHTRPGNTGTLRLSVWATQAPYNGGRIRGYELGRTEKRALRSGYVLNDIHDVMPYAPPPSGEYYTTVFLTEFDGSEYVIRAWLQASETSWFE
jgi:hypothetical protein